jgi:phosphate transport system permease protein
VTESHTSLLLNYSSGEAADRLFSFAMLACAVSILGLLALIVYELVARSQLSWHAFGWSFFVGHDWDPVNESFGALPFIYGTLVSSLLALVIAVPLSIGVAVFTTEMCPKWLRGPLSFTTELLAAIPSVIHGLWAIFVLVPLLRLYV